MSAILILESGSRVKPTQRALGTEITVLALPGQRRDYLPPATESNLEYFEADRRSGSGPVNGLQAQLQSLTRDAASVFLAFPPGGEGEALAAVIQKLIRIGRPKNARPAQILRVPLEGGAVVTPALLASATLVDLGLARAYQTQRVLQDLLEERASGLDPAVVRQYQTLVTEVSALVAAGRADARSAIHDFEGQLQASAGPARPPVAPAGQPGCPRCGKPLVARWGAQGSFTGCAGYPRCNFVVEAATGVPCPDCLRGQLVERRAESGRLFYGCTRFPDCRFTSTRKPAPGPCPDCGNTYLVERTLKSGVRVECPRKDCGFRRTPAN